MIYIFFQPGFEFSTLKNPENDTLLDYIASYIKIVKMEVTLTSTFYTKVTSSMIYIFFQTGFEFSTLKNPENDTLLDYIASYIKIVKMEVTLTSTFYTKVTSSMIYIFFQPGFEFSTLENPENGTLLDYIESYIKIVKMEVTLTSTFYLGDLQYDVHIF